MNIRVTRLIAIGLLATAAGSIGCHQDSSGDDANRDTVHQNASGAGGSGTGTNSGDAGTSNGGPAGVNK